MNNFDLFQIFNRVDNNLLDQSKFVTAFTKEFAQSV